MNQRINKAAIIISAVFILLCIILFINKNNILHYIVDNKLDGLRKEYNLSIHYDKLEMVGLDEIQLRNFSLVPNDRDTVITLKSFTIDLNPLALLGGRIEVYKAYVNELNLNLIKKDSTSNYDFLFKKKDLEQATQENVIDYSSKTKKILSLIFGLLPENGEITKFNILQRRDSSYTHFTIPDLIIKERHFDGNILIDDNGKSDQWHTKGYINSHNKELEASIYPFSNTKHINIPYINRYYNANVGFDFISFSLKATDNFSGENLNGNALIKGLHLFHKRLSPDTITINKGELSYNINIGKNSFELDSTSTVVFNELSFHPYIKVQKNKKWHITTSINQPSFNAQVLFNSLPAALFQHLQGIKTTGNLSYNFLLDIDFNNIDSLKFHSILRGKNFHIKDYGNSDLTRMNREFSYTAYENERPVRTFNIGRSNPNFRTLDSISPLLKNAILQSEDNGFMYHNGFLPGAIQEALIYDFKVKRFARGGSTISMQLVKNVFLTRHKNIARKLEEALIVWLIENQHITCKDRMYEVYLNIVEWGPLIYGAKEASEYYFGKEPIDLNLDESIFLASLIPRPKQFRSFFNPDGSLKNNQQGFFRLIANRLKHRGIISEYEADSIYPMITLRGKAKNDIIISDTLKVDTTLVNADIFPLPE